MTTPNPMGGRTLEEIFRRYEFNKTEPETLASLVHQAVMAGDGVRAELKRFREITEKVLKLLENKQVILIHINRFAP